MTHAYDASKPCSFHHDLMPLHDGIVYGPLRSRRLGWSLGLNLLPVGLKVCDFNCVYCQYGWTAPVRPASLPASAWPSPAAVAHALADALAESHRSGPAIDRITLAGHGEPTLHPAFSDVVEAILTTRDAQAPGVPVAILSNSTTAGTPVIREVLRRLDERYMKLDAGDAETHRQINAAAFDTDAVVAALASMPDIVVQTMFVRDGRGRVDNTTPTALGTWIRAIARIRPLAVHLYTIARPPAWAALEPVPQEVLGEIAARVRHLGIDAEAFG